jgi:hypothetical protein
MKLVLLLLGLIFPPTAVAFAPTTLTTRGYCEKTSVVFPPTIIGIARSTSFELAAAPAKHVWILKTEAEVTQAVHVIVEDAARRAIAERGHFALAIPGGSVLKVLSSLDAGDWASKTTLAYVNHKCVPNDDLSSAIHAKVRRKLLFSASNPPIMPFLLETLNLIYHLSPAPPTSIFYLYMARPRICFSIVGA